MRRTVFYAIGIILIGIGINMLIQSDKGLDPWGIFNVATAGTINVSLGTLYVYSGILFVVLNALIQKKRPDILGMVTSFLMGISIDLLGPLTTGIFLNSRWLEFFLGLIGLCFGLALYLSTHLPRSPVDDLIYSIQKVSRKSFKVCKIILDTAVLVIGLLLGGHLGIGTVIMVLATGPLITMFMNFLEGQHGENNLLRFRRHAYSNSRKL
jgi:hypothetical protein